VKVNPHRVGGYVGDTLAVAQQRDRRTRHLSAERIDHRSPDRSLIRRPGRAQAERRHDRQRAAKTAQYSM